MSKIQNHNGWTFLVGPSVAIVLFYFAFFQRSLDSQLKQETLRLNKLKTVVVPSEIETEQQKLAAISTQVKELEDQLALSRSEKSKLVSKRSELSRQLRGSSVPAASIASLLGVLERNGLNCISCRPNENPSTQLPDTLQPASRVLAPAKNGTLPERCELQVVVLGTFVEMQSALQDLSDDHLGVVLISVEMELPEDDTESRTWLLTAAVWEADQ
jgi:hypothetical protein